VFSSHIRKPIHHSINYW